MRFPLVAAVMLLASACSPPSPQPQPSEEDTVNATRVDEGAPAGALGNESGNYAEGPVTPGERGSIYDVNKETPAQVAGRFARLLDQGKYGDAYAMWDPQSTTLSKDEFAQQFDKFRTVDAAVGKIGPAEGAAGSIYDQVQLTLSGKTAAGENYVLTGPVTLKRVNDVPGSTAEQRRWRIVKMQLTAKPNTAEALIKG